jgi:hypothetical protein
MASIAVHEEAIGISELIGNTPLLRLSGVTRGRRRGGVARPNGSILAVRSRTGRR